MLAHYDRRKGGSESEIDPERSVLNYNLAQDIQPLDQLEFIHERLKKVYCFNRKDVNVMCDWVITAPKDLPADKEDDFFKITFDYLVTKYGKNNVVSSYVHKDETTPHMHFAFIPVVHDEKRNGLKVSAKEKITLGHLKTFHEELERHLSSQMHFKVNILNGATRDGNKSIKELKRGTAIEELENLETKIYTLNTRVQTLDLRVKALTKSKHNYEEENEKLESDKLKLQNEKLELQKVCANLKIYYDELLKNPPKNIDYKEFAETLQEAFFSVMKVVEDKKLLPQFDEALKDNNAYFMANQMIGKKR